MRMMEALLLERIWEERREGKRWSMNEVRIDHRNCSFYLRVVGEVGEGEVVS